MGESTWVFTYLDNPVAGSVIGMPDKRSSNVTSRVVVMGDLAASVYPFVWVDWTKEIMSPIGRRIQIANSFEDKTGEPLG